MDEKEQQEFVGWLKNKLQPKDDSDFQQKVQELGEEGIKAAHLEFSKAKVQQYMTGGRLEKIQELAQLKRKYQSGGSIYTTQRGNAITDSDLAAYKKSGLDFGTKQAMGDWMDKWATPVKPQAPAQPNLNKPRMVKRFNQGIMDYESVPLTQIMAEPNKMQTGFSNTGISNWDLSQYKKNVTPQDTIGASPAVRANVQQGWDMQHINPKPIEPHHALDALIKGTLVKK